MKLPSLPRTEKTHKSDFWPSVIKYRAFTAGQQTLLLQVSDPNTPIEERSATMETLFSECVEAGAPFNKLPIGVVEELFIKIRCISIGEILRINYKCTNKIEVQDEEGSHEEECGQELAVGIPLQKVKCKAQEGFKEVFDLPGGYHLKMRQPSYSDATSLGESTRVEDMIAAFVECLYDDDGQVWNMEDPNEPGISPEQAKERREVKETFVKWVGENIETDVIEDISNNFFRKIPRIHYIDNIRCPKCGKMHKIEFNSVNEIFI